MNTADARLKLIAASVSLQNVCRFYEKSSLTDFVSITSRPHRLSKSGTCTYSLALYSIVEANRYLRDRMLLWFNNTPDGWPYEWSMQTDMVGRNADNFNGCRRVDNLRDQSCIYREDYAPLSWRIREELDDGVYYDKWFGFYQ